ncbi:MAG: hypothetical protein ACRDD7_07535, partial [Peptostreptococcaceae bacterium]
IGEDVDKIKEYIEAINKERETEIKIDISYTEIIDENKYKNINLIRKSEYGTVYPVISFIVDEENIINEVRYINY